MLIAQKNKNNQKVRKLEMKTGKKSHKRLQENNNFIMKYNYL